MIDASGPVATEPKPAPAGTSLPPVNARSHVAYFHGKINREQQPHEEPKSCGPPKKPAKLARGASRVEDKHNKAGSGAECTPDLDIGRLVQVKFDDKVEEQHIHVEPVSSDEDLSHEKMNHALEPGSHSVFSEFVHIASISPEKENKNVGALSSMETQEPASKANESDDGVDHDWEWTKAVLSAILVVVFWSLVLSIFAIGNSQFEEPVCPEQRVARNCEHCGTGTIFVPLFGDYERSLPKALRTVMYFFGLLWVFLGIGIVCDQFMGAIEEITSAERVVWCEVRGGARHKFHIKVWNPTVANLTLMALGSSAPEIMLNVLEVLGHDYFAGDLGPSTIVGSAAFNLLVITAVCISALPVGEKRQIDNTDVFGVTATWSVFAYAWLVVILQLHTPDKVDVWEALVTFFYFPLLTGIAYAADQGLLFSCLHHDDGTPPHASRRKSSAMLVLRSQYGNVLPAHALEMLAGEQSADKKGLSKAKIRSLMNIKGAFKKWGIAGEPSGGEFKLTVGFEKHRHACFENAGTLEIKLLANRPPGFTCCMKYCTKDGTAQEGLRYKKSEGEVIFSPLQTEQWITVDVVDNDTWEEAMDFFIEISEFQVLVNGAWVDAEEVSTINANGGKAGRILPQLGLARATVTVLNDDVPGTLGFECDEVYVSADCAILQIGITRKNGNSGEITCRYRTVDGSAMAGKHFEATEAFVTFADGEACQTIQIELIKDRSSKFEESFKVILDDASPGVKFDRDTDGGVDCAITTVIFPGVFEGTRMERLFHYVFDYERFMMRLNEWRDQFVGALYCNGDAVEQAEAGPIDWVFHALSLVWKVLFAFVPPPGIFGGWLCFVIALGMIGFVTAIVGDIAGLLGCCIGIPDDITAITLVALGTSLPDTFASKVAAQQNPNADDSVGNVTGSNCVNVFLGLGLPWSIGAIYWAMSGRTAKWDNHLYHGVTLKDRFGSIYPDGGFIVPAGNLVFSVIVFTSCAICCIGLLIIRRMLYGAELGGPKMACSRDSAILGCLWLVYIVASIINSMTHQ